MWLLVGRYYVPNAPDIDNDSPAWWYLFAWILAPVTACIAFAAGVVVGLVPMRGGLVKPTVRAAFASIFFTSLFMLVAALFSDKWKPAEMLGVVDHLKHLGGLLLFFPLSLLFVFLVTPVYWVPAAVGGAIGNTLRHKQPNMRRIGLILVAALPLTVIAVQAVLIQLAMNRVDPALRKAEAQIDKHFMRLPNPCVWHNKTINHSFLPSVTEAECGNEDSNISVTLYPDGKLKFATAIIAVPKGTKLATQDAAGCFLLKNGVSRQFLEGLDMVRMAAGKVAMTGSMCF